MRQLINCIFVVLIVSTAGCQKTPLESASTEGLKVSCNDLTVHVYEAVNQERRTNRAADLNYSKELEEVARLHALDMAAGQKLTHTGSDGSDVGMRMSRSGVTWEWVGENVARNRGYRDSAGKAVVDWMESPGHRKNILSPVFTATGVGVAQGPDGYTYLVQVFIGN